MDYRQFFGLNEPPFRLTPDPDYFFPSDSHREAFQTLLYSIRAGEGFVQISGEPGTGKTLLVRTLLRELGNDVTTALIFNTQISPQDLLGILLNDLNIKTNVPDRGDRLESGGKKEVLLRVFHRFLLERAQKGIKVVIIADEAQNLPSETLEELRLLSNLETEKEKLLQIILVGQLELEEKLRTPELKQLDQRITIRYRLKKLNREECRSYIYHRLQIAGQTDNVLVHFSPKIIKQIHYTSRGIPRLINIICERTLMAAFVEGQTKIKKAHVKKSVQSIRGSDEEIIPRKRNIFLSPIYIGTVLIAVSLLGLGYYLMKSPKYIQNQSMEIFGTLEAAINQKESEIKTKDAQLSEKEKIILRQANELKNANNKIKQIQKDIKLQENLINEKNKDLNQEQHQLSELEHSIQEKESFISKREQALKREQEKIKQLAAQIQAKQSQVNAQKSNTSEELTKLSQLKANISEKQLDIQEKETELKEEYQKLSQVEANVKQKEMLLKEKEAELKATQATLKTYNQAIKEKETHLAKKELNLVQKAADIDQIALNLSEKEKKLNQKEEIIAKKIKQLEQTYSQKAPLDSDSQQNIARSSRKVNIEESIAKHISIPKDNVLISIAMDLHTALIWKGSQNNPIVNDRQNCNWPLYKGIYLLGEDKNKGQFLFNHMSFYWGGPYIIPPHLLKSMSQEIKKNIVPIIVHGTEIKPGPDVDNDIEKMKTIIADWTSAWQQMELKKLISFYGDIFTLFYMHQPKPLVFSNQQFYEMKKDVFNKSKYVKLDITPPTCIIDPSNPQNGMAVFFQKYRSDIYNDQGIKVLYFNKTFGPKNQATWKIVGKLWLPKE